MSSGNLFILAVTGLLLFVYELLKRSPDLVSPIILQTLLVAVLICGSIAAVNILVGLIIDLWLSQILKRQTSALLKLIVSLGLYFLCLVIIFNVIGLNITALFTTSALLTAIIGFALQPTLGNFFSGISLRLDQPFKIGDRIVSADQEGEVVSITWRATTIQTDDRLLVHIPNGSLAQDRVKVIPNGSQARRSVDFSVPTTIPPQHVIDTAYNALLNQPLPNLDLDRPLLVQLLKLEPGNSTYRIFYVPLDYRESHHRTDQDLLCRVWYALHRQQVIPSHSPSSKKHYLGLIQGIAFWQHFPHTAQKSLLRRSSSLLFDAGERLSEGNLPPKSLLIVVRGRLSIAQVPLPQEDGHVMFRPFSRTPKPQALGGFDPDTLDRITSQLVQALGPAAFRLVQETAQQVASVYSLYQTLSLAIDEPKEREQFLKHRPVSPTDLLRRGDFLGELWLFFNQPLPKTLMTTIEETELLVVPQVAIRTVLSQDMTLFDPMVHRLVQHINHHLLGTIQMPSAAPCSRDEVSQQVRQTLMHPAVIR